MTSVKPSHVECGSSSNGWRAFALMPFGDSGVVQGPFMERRLFFRLLREVRGRFTQVFESL